MTKDCIYKLEGLEDVLGNEIAICFKISDCGYKSLEKEPYYTDKLQSEQEDKQYICMYEPSGS